MFWYLGSDEAILAGQLNVDLAKLPAIVDIFPARGPMLAKLLLAVLWFLISLAVIAPFASTPFRIKMFLLVLPVAGLVMIAMSLYGLLRKRRVRFGNDRVVVRDKRWLGSVDWSAPYLAFQGIRLRRHMVNAGASNRTFHIVELKHLNPSLSLPLLVTSNDPPSHSALMSVAKVFGLPVLDDGEGVDAFRVQTQIFNRPFRELSGSHDLSELYDAGEPVPHELQVQRRAGDDGERLSVTIWPHRPRRIWQLLLVVGPAFLLTFALIAGSLLFLVEGLIFGGLGAFILWNGFRRCYRIGLSREALDYGAPNWSLGAPAPRHLRLDDIRGIYIEVPRSGRGHHIEIDAGGESLHLGHGISPAGLDWLRRFLISAVATA